MSQYVLFSNKKTLNLLLNKDISNCQLCLKGVVYGRRPQHKFEINLCKNNFPKWGGPG